MVLKALLVCGWLSGFCFMQVNASGHTTSMRKEELTPQKASPDSRFLKPVKTPPVLDADIEVTRYAKWAKAKFEKMSKEQKPRMFGSPSDRYIETYQKVLAYAKSLKHPHKRQSLIQVAKQRLEIASKKGLKLYQIQGVAHKEMALSLGRRIEDELEQLQEEFPEMHEAYVQSVASLAENAHFIRVQTKDLATLVNSFVRNLSNPPAEKVSHSRVFKLMETASSRLALLEEKGTHTVRAQRMVLEDLKVYASLLNLQDQKVIFKTLLPLLQVHTLYEMAVRAHVLSFGSHPLFSHIHIFQALAKIPQGAGEPAATFSPRGARLLGSKEYKISGLLQKQEIDPFQHGNRSGLKRQVPLVSSYSQILSKGPTDDLDSPQSQTAPPKA